MRNQLNALFVLSLIFFVFTCSKDDDNITSTPARDRAEQQASDMDTLQNYFETHYYNSGELNALSTYPTLDDIVISKLEDGESLPPNTTLLSEAVEPKTTTFKDVDYTYYILSIEEGLGEHPHFTDQVRVNYEGNTMDDEVFDGSVNPIDLDLIAVVPGWNRVLPQFKTSNAFTTNSDGSITFENYGIGVMFLPSGLAFFRESVNDFGTSGVNNNQQSSDNLTRFTPVGFKFDILQSFENDHDMDGVPSHIENNNPALNVDTDGDFTVDYLDTDDDGDGIPTLNEDIDRDGNPANDIGRNNIPRYLDLEEVEFVN